MGTGRTASTAILCLLAAMMAPGGGLSAETIPPSASYLFHSLPESLPESSYSDIFSERRFSMGTALNHDGRLFGYTLDDQGGFHGYSVRLADNPEMVASEHPGFILLAAPDCSGLFTCLFSTPLFGIRMHEDDGAQTALLTSSLGITDSLPFISFPGEFVSAGSSGIIASTQVGPERQYGMVLDPERGGPFALDEIPWLVDINDHETPQLLGYRGALGDCLVYGIDCIPPPDLCDEDEDHPSSNQGQGSGHAWGQNPCHRPWLGIEYHARNHCSEEDQDCNPPPGPTDPETFEGPLPAENESVLIQWNGNQAPVEYALPKELEGEYRGLTVSEVFPLALNNNTIVLRGNVSDSTRVYWQRLLRCDFDPDNIDPGASGVVNCLDGLRPVEGLESGTRIHTVLGFSLNNANTLVGNIGYRSGGTGIPVHADLDEETPRLELLVNMITGNEGRELHTLTDINDDGHMTGYGYTDCGMHPDTFFLTPETQTETGMPRFAPTSLPGLNTRIPPTGSVEITPKAIDSDTPRFRFLARSADDDTWQLLRDWSGNNHLTLTPEQEEGRLCLRIQLRDESLPKAVREKVIRFRTSNESDSSLPLAPETDTTINETSGGGFSLPGASSLLWLLVLAVAGLGRRALRTS